MKPLKFKEYIIRAERLSDAKGMVRLFNALVDENADINRNKKITLKEAKETLKEGVKNMKKKEGVYLAALKGKEFVGSVCVIKNHGKQSHTAGLGISILKPHRGKGLGEALMKAVIEESRKSLKGLEMISLGVFKRNKAAKNLYKKMGFKTVGVLPRVLKSGNKYFDEELMHYWLI
ncbi:MAG: GNAT family N-acetyltransferase [Nanoarchaeota archaeon]|nr:GNAT family N-acetyltransferase [Nanoarchaeota archaeon]